MVLQLYSIYLFILIYSTTSTRKYAVGCDFDRRRRSSAVPAPGILHISFLVRGRVGGPHARQREIQIAQQCNKTFKALSSRCQGRLGLRGVFLHRHGTCSVSSGEGALRQTPPDQAVDGAGGSGDGVTCHED